MEADAARGVAAAARPFLAGRYVQGRLEGHARALRAACRTRQLPLGICNLVWEMRVGHAAAQAGTTSPSPIARFSFSASFRARLMR